MMHVKCVVSIFTLGRSEVVNPTYDAIILERMTVYVRRAVAMDEWLREFGYDPDDHHEL